MWIYLGLVSALFLGVYDLSKKHALKENAVLPVLFLGSLFGALILLPLIFLSGYFPELLNGSFLFIEKISIKMHFLIILKALIMSSSWVFAYFALKYLPISIVSPIRSSSPIWTLLGAVIIFSEFPTLMQWIGLLVVFISYYLFSLLGLKEGIVFHKNKWIFFIVAATLLSSCSGLYDKHLLHTLDLEPVTLQAWVAIYNAIILGVITLFLWYPKRSNYTSFKWRWSIPMIGLLLVIADIAYFTALHDKVAMVSLLSAVRRCNVVVAFLVGGYIFKEQNILKKSMALIGVIVGVFLIIFSVKQG